MGGFRALLIGQVLAATALAAQWDPEASPASNRALAERIADRYARLSAEHGPWRLAWLESLLKAADAWVSSGGDA